MNTSARTVPRVHIVGRRNSGKTTLVCELIQELTQRGFRVASVKHTHHHHELDTPGKDSWKHRESGAAAVGILSPQMTAVFVPQDREDPDTDSYDRLLNMFPDCDLLIVEGDLHADAVKLEVWRQEVSEPPYATEENGIIAVISDSDVHTPCERLARNDLSALADYVSGIMADQK